MSIYSLSMSFKPRKTLHDPTCAMVKTCYVEPRSSQWIVTIPLKGKDSPCFDHGTYVHIYILYVYYMYTICILYMYTIYVYICTHPVLSIYPPHIYPSGRPSHWEVPCSPAPLWSWSHLAAPHPFRTSRWFLHVTHVHVIYVLCVMFFSIS